MKAQKKLNKVTKVSTSTTPKLARRKISPTQISKKQIATVREVEEAINFAGARLRTLGEDYERLAWLLEDVLAQLYAARDEAREQFSLDDLPDQLFKVG